MKNHLRRVFFGILVVVIFCLGIIFNIENDNSRKCEIKESNAVAVIKHEKAYNVYCRYWPAVEGCCDHEWRTCTNQSFCQAGECQ